jgi:pectinesterase
LIIIAQDGTGDFNNIQDAIDAIPSDNTERMVIYIKNGIYQQKVTITKPGIHLIGEDAAKTILTYHDYARKLLPSGEPMNTFNSYSVYIGGSDFTAENITFENSSGDGDIVGQAVAVYVDADRTSFKNCRFLGCQDTLFTGPLPKNPTPLGLNLQHPTLGSGPSEYTGIIRQYYQDCFIQGDVDFIFGSATAVFNRCEIFSNDRGQSVNGYITAGSTSPHTPFGYVFMDCRLTSKAPPMTVYLGRPWRDFAKVAFLNCWMGSHIVPAGWHNWDKPEREKTVTYAEYGSTGPGAAPDQRVPWARTLLPEQLKLYTLTNILSGLDHWKPYNNSLR